MAKVVVYDEKGKPHAVEAVDAREMLKPGPDGKPSLYKGVPPDGKAATLADVETRPGEPQYPPTAQPEHPMPTEHQVTQQQVLDRQAAHARGEVPPPEGFDKDGKRIQPPAVGQPFPVPPNAPQFANTGKPAVPPGTPGSETQPATTATQGKPAAGVPPTGR